MLRSVTSEQDIEFAQMIMTMLDDWGVGHDDKILLLDFPPDVKVRGMRRFYIDRALPNSSQVSSRIDHLLGIADAIRTSYPLNEKMAHFWLNKKNHRFENLTPLEFMLHGGTRNVISVRTHLDCAWDWNQDDEA
jgi:hypothetical protein